MNVDVTPYSFHVNIKKPVFYDMDYINANECTLYSKQ